MAVRAPSNTTSTKAPTETRAPKKGRANFSPSEVRIGEHQILNYAKESKDRLLLLHDTLKERLDSTFGRMQNATTDRDRVRQKEDIMLLKMLVGRLQLGIYDSHLIIEICHYLQNYDQALGKSREQARRLLLENGKIREQIDTLSEQTYAKEAQLASTHELLGYWEFMANAAATELITDGENLSPHELWKNTFNYKEFNLRNELFEIPEPERYCYHEICRHVCANELDDAMRVMRKFLNDVPTDDRSERLMYLLILMSNFCIDGERYGEGIQFLQDASQIATRIGGACSGLACGIKCRIAAIYWMDLAIENAIDVLVAAVDNFTMEKRHESHPLTARIYFNIGFFYMKNDKMSQGFKIMEMALLLLEASVQAYEDDWFEMTMKLAKCLNVGKYYKHALYVTIDAYQYWMDNHTKTTHAHPLYEVAFEQASGEVNCNEIQVPEGEYLSNTLREILSEMKLGFNGCLLVSAGDLIGQYVDCCRKFDRENVLSEDEMHAEINRIMEKRDRYRYSSMGSVMHVLKQSTKNPLKLSDKLQKFLIVEEMPVLDYKVVSKVKQPSKGVFKQLQTLVRGR